MIDSVMKAYLKKAHRALHAWRIKENSTLTPLKLSIDEPLILNSKNCYLLAKYSKGESFDSAHTVCKVKFWVWIGCQCSNYHEFFSPILQYCRELKLPQLALEVFAEFQFNESIDFLFWFNTNLGDEVNPYYHSTIHYSYLEEENASEYFMILKTVEDGLTNRNFTSVNYVPTCTKTAFPECSYIWLSTKNSIRNINVLLGSIAPEPHEMIANLIIKQKEKSSEKVIAERNNVVNSKWNEQFDKGGYDYLVDNFWNEEEEREEQHKDFADITVEREELKEEEVKRFSTYRVYFESYKDSIKGRLENEQKRLSLGVYKISRATSEWKLHFKPTNITKEKQLDSKEIIIFNFQRYIIVWMGGDIPLWITSKLLAITKAYVQQILKIDTNFKPYYLWDELVTNFKYFLFISQGKESHRFKSLFPKWKPLSIPYYNFPAKRAIRQKFRTEKKSFKAQYKEVKTVVDTPIFNYWKCIRSIKPNKVHKELTKNIAAFPYNLIYGFKIKEQRIGLPIYLHHIDVYQLINKSFVKLLEKRKYIWSAYNNYFLVITFMSSPNAKPLYFFYLWCGCKLFSLTHSTLFIDSR